MNDPKIEPAELKRRKVEKAKRYKTCMALLSKMGFVQDEQLNIARLKSSPATKVDMDDPDIWSNLRPEKIICILLNEVAGQARRAAMRNIRESLGIFQ